MKIAANQPLTDVQSRIEKAVRGYTPQVYPGRVNILRASGSVGKPANNPDLAWRTVAAGGLDVRIGPGSHDEIFDEPNVVTLANEFWVARRLPFCRLSLRERSPADHGLEK